VAISGPIRILPQSGGFQPRAIEGQSYGASNQIVKLLTSKTVYSMYFPKVVAVEDPKSTLLAVTVFIRQSVADLLNKILPPDLSSLLLGIVFGIKGPMSKEFINNLRLAGVMHVIAASGMNITMIAGFLSAIFMLFLKRQVALIASILGFIFYAFLAGMQSSIIRAAIMGILVFSSQVLGRQNLAAYGLFLAGFIILMISPLLISDVGFQLSFTATLGLLHIGPLFKRVEKINGLVIKKSVSRRFNDYHERTNCYLADSVSNFWNVSSVVSSSKCAHSMDNSNLNDFGRIWCSYRYAFSAFRFNFNLFMFAIFIIF